MVLVRNVELELGETYSAAEIRSTFNKGRAGRGITINYDENDNKFLRLFSSPGSEYGDDLEADPMRYVGEKNPDNPAGDQVPKGGNGALIESQDKDWPVFLFEKISENPVRYLFHGRVEAIDVEHNYRPEKDKREFDFYLRQTDTGASGEDSGGESTDDLAPSSLRDIDPDSRDLPEREERITYESDLRSQAAAANEHERTVALIDEWLTAGRWTCKETVETDILASSETEALVIEVKSIDGSNDGDQLRKALGQVFENCYRDVKRRGWGDRDMIPCICFSQPPADRYSGYLEFLVSQGIEVLWRTDDGVGGYPDSVERLREVEQ